MVLNIYVIRGPTPATEDAGMNALWRAPRLSIELALAAPVFHLGNLVLSSWRNPSNHSLRCVPPEQPPSFPSEATGLREIAEATARKALGLPIMFATWL